MCRYRVVFAQKKQFGGSLVSVYWKNARVCVRESVSVLPGEWTISRCVTETCVCVGTFIV